MAQAKGPTIDLAKERFEVERKEITLSIHANSRGKYLKIVEFTHGRKNISMVPEPGWEEFQARLSKAIDDARANPAFDVPVPPAVSVS